MDTEDSPQELYKDLEKESLELDNDIFRHDKPRRDRPEFFMPAGTEVLKVFDFLEIDMTASGSEQSGKWSLLFITLFWNIMVFGIMAISVASGGLGIVFFLSMFLIAGGVLAWQTLGRFFNHRKVVISQGKLTTEVTPFKVNNGFQEYDTSEIEQLYVSKYFTGTVINEQRMMAYSLSAILKSKQSVRIISNSNLETALYLEQEIERFLNITDQPVSGEILQ